MIEEEQEKLREIITKGMESFQSGNADEALAIADHAILTNPSYAEAYALKGLAHERKGAYAEALDAYETVVALNPDSTIDKIKLNQLRNAFAQRQAGDP
ncbi:MAG TPA: tetratricopeptide repeat protein, partial [Fimbriimonas sp.]|nr:tetratricopeptide repeat protein [Fimbriimonas sp.]